MIKECGEEAWEKARQSLHRPAEWENSQCQMPLLQRMLAMLQNLIPLIWSPQRRGKQVTTQLQWTQAYE
jgi:hypothetical protein